MIAQELEVSLHMAFVEARQQRHEFITVEHLLMALLDNPSAAEVLRACAANIDDLRKSLTTFIKENTPTVGGGRVVQQREQQVLDGDELMALLARLDERHVQADFKFLGNHAASIMHCNGWPPRRAAASTNSTFVAATSFE